MWAGVQVVDVLRSLSHRDELADAIDYSRLGKEEVEALGRVVRTLPREERRTDFWIDVDDQVSAWQGLMLGWQIVVDHIADVSSAAAISGGCLRAS